MSPSPLPISARDVRIALLTAFVALLVYNANLRLIASGDSYPARFIPFALWKHGTVYLDEIREAATQRHRIPYWLMNAPNGRSASVYPVVTPILVTPLYGPAVLYLEKAGWSYENLSRVGAVMEKFAGSCVASSAVFLMFLVLRRRLDRRDALLLTGAFAFGTTTWAVSSQALWQHGPAELLLLAALWFITGESSRANTLAAGFATGLLVANRAPDVLLAVALSLYALYWARGRAVFFALAAALPLALVVTYNLITFSHLGGGYGAAGVTSPSFFAKPILPGVAGLLVSPGLGLFVFCPFLLFLPFLFHRSLRDRKYRLLTVLLAGAVISLILLYAPTDWRGGYAYGPRYLTDAVPALIWMLAPVLASLGTVARTTFLACCLFAAGVQYIGAFHFTGKAFLTYYAPPAGPDEMRNVWVPANAGFLLEGSNPRQPRDVWHTLRSLAHPVPSARPLPPVPPPPLVSRQAAGPPRPSHPSDFYTVPPCILVDTRKENPLMRDGPPRALNLAGARCSIPATATAIVVKVAVPERNEGGTILLCPDGVDQGCLAVSFGREPQTVEVILPLAADGSGTVMVKTNARSVHLMLEVGGYFATD
ncbi:MAG TPA: hypothetical protein VNW71_16125 [Thermoanaerobaculia bacterium]|nr:hypothetical protein [Thermoanaerobaculia bacterium]